MPNLTSFLLSTLTSTALVSFVIWMFREAIKARLVKSIEHEFDTKLEGLRSDLRVKEDALYRRLNAREAALSSVRAELLGSMSKRQAGVDARRLIAAEQIWTSVLSLNKLRHITATIQRINYAALLEEAKKGSKIDPLIDMMGGAIKLEDIDTHSAQLARPFVPEAVWVHYSAIAAILTYSFLVIQALKARLDASAVVDQGNVKKLIATVLPEVSDQIDSIQYFDVLPQIEDKLLVELRNMLSGASDEGESTERAARIAQSVTELVTANERTEAELSKITK